MEKFMGLYVSEDVNSDSISVVERIKGNFDSRYKYLIGQFDFCVCPRAFETKSGYEYFLKNYKLKRVGPIIKNVSGGDIVLCYNLKGRFRVCLFWHKNDLPVNCKSFIGLCNGNYVTCYYKDIDGYRVIFKPNSNAKEVYKPLDYFKCAKRYG